MKNKRITAQCFYTNNGKSLKYPFTTIKGAMRFGARVSQGVDVEKVIVQLTNSKFVYINGKLS